MEKNMSRRRFLGVVGTASVAAAFAMGSLSGCNANNTTPVLGPGAEAPAFKSEGKGQRLVCGVTGKLIKIAPAIIADKLGYFQEEGCNVEFQTIALADAMASMSVNRLDIDLFGVVPACTYISQGTGIYIFGGTILNGSEILSHTSFNRPLKTADDFRDLNIACSREETGQMFLKNHLQKNGLELNKDVEFVYVDNSTTAMEGLRSGQHDLWITNNAMGFSLGIDDLKVAGTVVDVTGNYPCCRQNCSVDAYNTKYLSLVDFEVALLRGYDYYLNNKDAVIPMLCEYSSQEADYVEAAMYGTATYRNVMNLSPDPYCNAVKEFYDALQELGEIDPETPYSIDEYAVSDIYRQALDIMLEREPNNETYKTLDQNFAAHNL
ncbi:ABC transporter substrate-binding protein [Desulfitobacterium chlororespirans]|uniref:ABC-type nitrate/sulfonate/bicarbonate transport system, substrate-binding protein n=1 Tax=Desulfitobacterium chlororespirans DSM 11544 TaxID=1121395 RepID=A0A1M7SHM5_9FIRM|nr:ABC transporter substrate-binding protein [Desulfitobacterium chlororespirans]SHN57963.1 ABC-type nitrate/sulfonate/bicarbonate transport system, substrate-binding protein [Desulfitobacterium chlororespirans DSM 11544]